MFSVQVPILKILSFAAEKVSVATTHFCNCSREAAIDKKQMGVAVFQYTFIYKNKL